MIMFIVLSISNSMQHTYSMPHYKTLRFLCTHQNSDQFKNLQYKWQNLNKQTPYAINVQCWYLFLHHIKP